MEKRGGVTYYTAHTHIQFKTNHIDTVKQPFISDMFTKVAVGHKTKDIPSYDKNNIYTLAPPTTHTTLSNCHGKT